MTITSTCSFGDTFTKIAVFLVVFLCCMFGGFLVGLEVNDYGGELANEVKAAADALMETEIDVDAAYERVDTELGDEAEAVCQATAVGAGIGAGLGAGMVVMHQIGFTDQRDQVVDKCTGQTQGFLNDKKLANMPVSGICDGFSFLIPVFGFAILRFWE